jgi:hypothetical protein
MKVFKTSSFTMTNKIDYPEWNANNLDRRQLDFAKHATTIWKISYYQN